MLASMHPTWRTVVVGDTMTPKDWSWGNVTFLPTEIQEKLGYRINKYIPHGHYARKNIGYLFAIAHGAKVIYETDDNYLLTEPSLEDVFLVEPGRYRMDEAVTGDTIINPYHLFGQPTCE